MNTKDKWPIREMLKIGIVAGNFDVIHPGYVRMFEDAKQNACNYLVVALQSDPTIDRPEKSKPVQTVEEREYILKSIRYVDEVIHYNTEKELLDILKNFDYDMRILGTDYNIPGKVFTGYELNKPIYFHKRDHSYSATDLKKRIANQVINEK
jgi:glycerol-3-phosphate cytidylyltransferase